MYCGFTRNRHARSTPAQFLAITGELNATDRHRLVVVRMLFDQPGDGVMHRGHWRAGDPYCGIRFGLLVKT